MVLVFGGFYGYVRVEALLQRLLRADMPVAGFRMLLVRFGV